MSTEETIDKLSDLRPFIAYLESTTDSEWVCDIVRTKGNTQNCIMGHLVNWFYGKDFEGNMSPAWDWFEEMWATTYMIYPVNDGQSPSWMNYKYDQPTARERVIAYLKNLWLGLEKPTWRLMEEQR